jgi:hypothetical protein
VQLLLVAAELVAVEEDGPLGEAAEAVDEVAVAAAAVVVVARVKPAKAADRVVEAAAVAAGDRPGSRAPFRA